MPHYASDAGVRHPKLKGDFFGEGVSLARKHGMTVIGYYSLQFNQQAVLAHPDWSWVDEQGKPRPWPWGVHWAIPCLDTPYRDYALKMVEEIVSRYEIDELFYDIFGMQNNMFLGGGGSPFCYCPATVAAWNEEHPGDDYRAGFNTREGWLRRYRWFKKRSMPDILDATREIAKRHRPSLLIAVNGGPEFLPDEVQQRVDFLYAEEVNSPTGIALGAIEIRGWGRPNYQSGAFDWRDDVDRNSPAVLRVRSNALTLENARNFFVGEAPLISGYNHGRGWVQGWFDMAEAAWHDLRNVDGLLDDLREPVTSMAMLLSLPTQEAMAAQNCPLLFRNGVRGALELLSYLGRPLESIPESRLAPEFLGRFDTFVLPEVEVLSDRHAELIRNWVREGGTLVATYRCGLLDENYRSRGNFAISEVLGVDYGSEVSQYAENYLEQGGDTFGFPGSYLNVRRTTAKEMLRHRLPMMVQDMAKNKWYNWGPPPAGRETAGPGFTVNHFGRGLAMYFSMPLFRLMHGDLRRRWMRELVPEWIRRFTPPPAIEIGTSPRSDFVHGTFLFNGSRQRIVAQVLNTLPVATDGESRPARGISIRIDPARLKVTAARMVWPEAKDLPLTTDGGRLVINLPELDVYAAICLRLAERPGGARA